MIGTAFGWSNFATIVAAIVLAFFFGYLLTLWPLSLFWGSLALALGVAYPPTFVVNRWLIARGRGHAVVHQHH